VFGVTTLMLERHRANRRNASPTETEPNRSRLLPRIASHGKPHRPRDGDRDRRPLAKAHSVRLESA